MDLTPEEVALIKKHRAEQAERSKFKPRLADEYTVEEKVEAFDGLHSMALFVYNQFIENGYAGDENKNYIYEAAMEWLSQPGQIDEFWVAYNKGFK